MNMATDRQLQSSLDEIQAKRGGPTKPDEYLGRPDGRFLETDELRYLVQQNRRIERGDTLTADGSRERELMLRSITWDAEHVPAGLTRTEAAELHSLNQRTGFAEACSDIFTFCKPHMS
jgi:hypothetical protein